MLKCLLCQLEFEALHTFCRHCILDHLDFILESEQLLDKLISKQDFQKCIDDASSQKCACGSKMEFSNTMGYSKSLDDLHISFCKKMSTEIENVEFQCVRYTNNIITDHEFCDQTGEPQYLISSSKKYIAIILDSDHSKTCCYKYAIIGCLINSFIGLEEAKVLDDFIEHFPSQNVEKISVRETANNVLKIKKEQQSIINQNQVFSNGKQFYKSLCKNKYGDMEPCFHKNGAKSIPVGCNVGDGHCIFRLRTKNNDFRDSRRKHFRGLKKFDNNKEREWYEIISKYSTKLSKLYMEAFEVAFVLQCVSTSKSCSRGYNAYEGRACFSGISLNVHAIKHWYD